MESYFQSIVTVQKYLQQAGIASIVIGGVAVAAWGEPRVTRDVDLKIQLTRHDADRLINLLSTDYTMLLPNPGETIQKHALIFIQDAAGTRLDLLLADTPYDQTAIQRGQEIEIEPGISICICSPEDLIIYKLISTRLRDHEDAGSVIRRQADKLDDAYVIGWLEQFEKALDDSTLVAEYKQQSYKYNKP
jgi:hypothetical protein